MVTIGIIASCVIGCGNRFEAASNGGDPTPAVGNYALTIDIASVNDSTDKTIPTVAFGNVSNINGSSDGNMAQRRVSIQNSSSSNISLDSTIPFFVSGYGFSISSNSCSSTLSANSSCELMLALKVSNNSYSSADLMGALIINRNSSTKLASVQLTGSVQSSITPDSLGSPILNVSLDSSFSHQDIANRPYRLLTIKNIGNGIAQNLTVSGYNGDYSERLSTCSTYLIAGESCMIEVLDSNYSETDTNAPDANLTVTATAQNSAKTISSMVTLTSRAQISKVEFADNYKLTTSSLSASITIADSPNVIYLVEVSPSNFDGTYYLYTKKDIVTAFQAQYPDGRNLSYSFTVDSDNNILLSGSRSHQFSLTTSISTIITNTQEATP